MNSYIGSQYELHSEVRTSFKVRIKFEQKTLNGSNNI